MKIWFPIIIFLYIISNYLIGRQLYDLIRVNAIAFWAVFTVLAFSPVLSRIGPFSFLERVGDLWMVIFYYATFVAIVGLFVKNKPVIIGSYALIFMVILIGSAYAKNIKVVSYDIEIPKQGSNLGDINVILLSDTHINKLKGSGYVKKMVSDINRLNPDIVLLAGDIFDDQDINTLKKEKETLKGIKSKYGVYGVVGNHEYYSRNLNESLEIYEEVNINILIDEVVEFEGLYLVGRDDVYGNRAELSELMQNVDQNKPIILLDHQPVGLDEAKNNGVDLQLSGHTHKGQFFPNNLITGRIFEVDYGYLAKDNLQVIVTSGYGTWGPPVRIGSQSEIVQIKLSLK